MFNKYEEWWLYIEKKVGGLVLAQKYKITCLATFLIFEASVRSDFLRHQSELIGWLEALNTFCSDLETWFVQKEQVRGSRNEKKCKKHAFLKWQCCLSSKNGYFLVQCIKCLDLGHETLCNSLMVEWQTSLRPEKGRLYNMLEDLNFVSSWNGLKF